ncbi:NADPH-dependent FMN reductase [Ancylobacter novellus DSM 506]|uniref:NADPH-dependent FMN reductase n=1 Tax=Ancylobacter novellus (strain ATCC 8093 / DSM 506 / JCM 20403 / CCM 1077 / IAM 12100 / NBRC 12443 / NCIMB 10456) TaxID=639283 RepID=D7A0H3_ANCN5|nr:NAD(P)H-dependent oxidoreductase [Ancylobacter novellus]ADH91294.1 NADPH-dependent FMN reductase [Ancylobacter novellus DSM 506]
MRAPRIVVFAGSIRTGSYSARLAALAARELALMECEPVLLSLADYPLPIYDADLEAESGVPEPARQLRDQLASADGVFIATPEYNAGFPPLLKNAIDWASRVRGGEGDAFKGPVYAIGSTSPGGLGGYRASMMLRQTLALGLNVLVLAEQVMVAGAANAFTEDGDFKDERALERLRAVMSTLIEQAALRAGLRA